ncbi:hypothetical protein DFR74_117141 [Nocardia puris]|uniref:Uncharacterized protein n=1 Tax=Nocardia puris TaxID=208602 RepID=A0A366D485_9NOCA|nr:hypothetical protein DFR74_117141 [Nocardia puris]
MLVIADEVENQDSHRKSLWEFQHVGTAGWGGPTTKPHVPTNAPPT